MTQVLIQSQKQSPSVHWFKRSLARATLNVLGWKTEVDDSIVHSYPQYIIVAAPHTSNWDAIVGGLGFMAENIGTSIIIKKEWLSMPLVGSILSSLGAIGVDRSRSMRTVGQIVRLFKANPQFVLVITPEGTRQKVEYWKSGFYYIAQKANVPLVLGYPDYRRKVCGIAPIIVFPTGDIDADMAQFKEVYDAITPRHPQNKTEIKFDIHADSNK